MTKISISKEEVKHFFEGHWHEFYGHYLEVKSSKDVQYAAKCSFHADKNPSFSFRSDNGLWKCFGCLESGDAFTFYGLLKGVPEFPQILEGIAQDFNLQSSDNGPSAKQFKKRKIIATYDYTDPWGQLLYQVVRFEPKDFRQRRPDGTGGWIWNMKGVERTLYRLPEVLEANQVLIVEGERDADNVKDLDFIATTCPGGAEKWKQSYSGALADKDVIILPDNDTPGRRHSNQVAKSLEGVALSIKILELPDLPEKCDISDWIRAGGTRSELETLIEGCPEWEPEEDPKQEIKDMFSRGPFPWEILPESISESLKQLARSCASSATSLPGAAIAIFASLIGATVSVSPKKSWQEPLIFWICDIRPSGSGKTPAARSLCHILYKEQSRANREHKTEQEEWDALPKKYRGDPPPKARGFYVTDLTLEGLREDYSGHGGVVCVFDEMSAFISSQNQYKKKGSDRETWIKLHDGFPARNVRANGDLTLEGVRVSIFGGIQPEVWKKSFSDEKGLFLKDGTIFRFLPTYEGAGYHPLTLESWSDENREEWEIILTRAMKWADSLQETGIKKSLCLSREAQEAFLDWRNELTMMKDDLPSEVRGFVPKLAGYALRLAGVLYLMNVFSQAEEPGSVLNVSDVQKGIRASEFYLGHIIDAMEVLKSKKITEVFEITDQVIHLAKTLENLKPELDNGRLAIGYIQEQFDKGAAERELKVNNSRFMGSLLRKCGLTITGGRYRANGKTGVYCLIWDKKTELFIKKTSTSPSCPQNGSTSGSVVMEERKPTSIMSIRDEKMMDMMEEEKPKSIKQEADYKRVCGHDGLDGRLFYNDNEKQAPEFFEL